MPPVIPAGALRRHAQPALTAEGLVLRPWTLLDTPLVEAAYRDPEIQRWHVRSMTNEEARNWVQAWPERWTSETGAGWAILEGGVLVGRVGFRTLNLDEGSGEAAYWVVPGARGRGIAGQALAAVTEWLFSHVDFHRMTLLHSTRNGGSCRVALKAGYRFEGIQKQQALHIDGWHDMHVHARLRDDPT